MPDEQRLSEWVGALHIHSTYSDGRKDAEKIFAVARRLGLDFCIITDHDDLSALPLEGYVDNTLLLVGSEITCSDNSHCLALGIRHPLPAGLPPQQVIDAINQAGGMSIPAHPFDRGSPRFGTYYPWKDWTVGGYHALELWNFLVNWGEGVTNLAQAARGFLFPLLHLTGPNPEGLQRWDRLNEEQFAAGELPVPVIGGVDAHGYFSYRRSMATIRTHLWGPAKRNDLAADRHTILRAIRTGRTFLANDALHNARGFLFRVVGKTRSYPQQSAEIDGPAEAHIRLPKRATIRLIHNGEVLVNLVGAEAKLPITRSGTYRCEVELSYMGLSRPWIFSNAVHVRMPE